MRVNINRLAFGGAARGADGRIAASGGSCAGRGGANAASAPVPPLIAEATINVGGSNGWVAPSGNRSEKLISFAVTPGGATSVTVSPVASALVPGIEAVRALAN
jgi:hypothetical protein